MWPNPHETAERWKLFFKKGGHKIVLNFAKFIGKHMRQSLSGLRPTTLLKKRVWHRCFPVKFFRTPFLQYTSEWPFLILSYFTCFTAYITPEYGFSLPIFSHIKTESTILSLNGKTWVRGNPYSGVFHAVLGLVINLARKALKQF